MAQSGWIGQKLGGRYEIETLLGEGGMASVYKANDPNLRRVVAVKLIHPHLSRDPEFVRRFEAEASAVAQMRHPHVIQVFDYASDQDVFYIVFEFVAGVSLQEHLARLSADGRRMSFEEAAKVGRDIASALKYAHERGLIHRDVKPANVMLNFNGDGILMDFGIVKIAGGTQYTATGAVIGTARYMSPEQIRGEEIDHRADIYALGIMLFQMVTGRLPYEADSAMTVMMMQVNDPIPDPMEMRSDVPPDLVRIITKALQKDKLNRYQTADELLTELNQAQLTFDSTPASQPATPRQPALSPAAQQLPPPTTPPARTPAAPAAPATAIAEPTPAAVPAAFQPGFSEIIKQPKYLALAFVALVMIFLSFNGLRAILDNGASDLDTIENPADSVADNNNVDDSEALARGAVAISDVATNTPEPSPTNTPEPSPTNTPEPTATVEIAAAQEEVATPTITSPPTATVTPEPPPSEPTVRIDNIRLEGGRYLVDYTTFEYQEALPGMHVHFFFNTVYPQDAGFPGNGPWYVWGGPRPFDGYTTGDKPSGASQMCALVANGDHSVNQGTGNCAQLPSD